MNTRLLTKKITKLTLHSIILVALLVGITGCDPASIGFYGESGNQYPSDNTTPNNPFNTNQDSLVSADDGIPFGYSVTQNPGWGHMRFERTIDVPASSITQIDIVWNGYGRQAKPNGANSTDGASMYIWNYANSAYELLAVSPNTESEVTLTATLTSSLTNYFDTEDPDTNPDIGVLLITTNSKRTGNDQLFLVTDYVAATVTSVPAQDTLQIVAGSGAASTCLPRSITINVCSTPACTALNTSFTGTINLITSTNQGNWASQGLGTLTPNPDNNDDGAASYTFSASDSGSVTLDLANQHAGSLTITAENAANGDTATSSAIDFQDNAFVISDIDTLASSDVVVAGRNHRYQAALWRRDTSQSPADCAVASEYNGSKAIKAWRTVDALDPGGNAPRIGTEVLPNSIPGTTNLSLNFTAGVAVFDLTTEDVGKYSLNIADDSGTFANETISGSSATQTVRPFGLGFKNIVRISDGLANPGGTATADDGFAAAGEAFGYQIGGYLYASADDSDNNGVPDTGSNVTNNGSTPKFAADVSLSISSITPSGTAGTLTPTIISAATFSNGSSTATNGSYDEVGSVVIAASSVDYLGNTDADIIGLSPIIGRFYPAELVLTAPTLPAISHFTEVGAPSCADSFVYMEEPALALSFKLEARNTNGDVTVNYDQTLGYGYLATPVFVAEASDNGVDLSARLSAPVSSGTWVAGALNYDATDHKLSRISIPAPTPDYAAALVVGVQISNLATSDNVDIAGLDMHPAQTPGCGTLTCTARALTGTVDVRYGRLVVNNAYGPENQDLNVPLHSEYYDGSSFVLNTLDNCSSYSIATATRDFSPYPSDNLDDPETNVIAPVMTTTLINGKSDPTANLLLSTPGAGNDGQVDLILDVPAWLEYDWNGLGAEDPKGTASFGHYRGHDRIIYWREAH